MEDYMADKYIKKCFMFAINQRHPTYNSGVVVSSVYTYTYLSIHLSIFIPILSLGLYVPQVGKN